MEDKVAAQRSLMRAIWSKTISSEIGQHRLRNFGQPWLVENWIDDDGHETRVQFDSGRVAMQIPFWERAQRFRQSAQYLYHQALAVKNLGMSYRDFTVGSAALAFREHVPHFASWQVFTGMNTKHARNMRPVCSEPITINAAYASGYALIIGIVVVGQLREEDITATLHPCIDCRWFMSEHPLIDRDTFIMTVTPPGPDSPMIREVTTFGRLLKLHRRISGDDFTKV